MHRLPAMITTMLCLAPLFASLPVRGEIIDRIAVTVDDSVITESEILRQIRLAAFQNGEKPDFSRTRKRDAAEKLIEQFLIRKEINTARYPLTEDVNTDAVMQELSKQWGGPEKYQAALKEYGLTDREVREQVKWQLTLIPFIDVRFKPGIQLSDADLREYYEKTWLPRWRQSHNGDPLPSFEDAREDVQDELSSQRADHALDFWLGEARRQVRIRFRPEAFQ